MSNAFYCLCFISKSITVLVTEGKGSTRNFLIGGQILKLCQAQLIPVQCTVYDSSIVSIKQMMEQKQL